MKAPASGFAPDKPYHAGITPDRSGKVIRLMVSVDLLTITKYHTLESDCVRTFIRLSASLCRS